MKTPKKRVEALEEKHSSTDAGPVEIVVCWDDAELVQDENSIIIEWPDDENTEKTN
jgi:hypothetical protein